MKKITNRKNIDNLRIFFTIHPKIYLRKFPFNREKITSHFVNPYSYMKKGDKTSKCHLLYVFDVCHPKMNWYYFFKNKKAIQNQHFKSVEIE